MTSPTTTLRDEQQLITTLVDLMKQEQQFLVSADSDGLNTITPQKSSLVQQMASLASQRHQALGAAGFPAREAGMEDWLASANDSAARTLWLDLLERTREAKELNRVNGILINKQLTNTQVVLNAMRTPAGAAESGGVYGPGGQTAAGGPSRRFVVG
jgi:flagella synthesis protein FlgN